jgi:hypothetical protein
VASGMAASVRQAIGETDDVSCVAELFTPDNLGGDIGG